MEQLIIFGAEYLLGGIIAGAVVGIRMYKNLRLKILYAALIALPLGYALARAAGLLFQHHQPFAEQGFEPLVPHAVDNSFPSDHVLMGGIFSSLAFLGDKRFGLALWVLTLLVGLSRMLAGLHYAVDVFVSVVLALLAVGAAWMLLSFTAAGK